MNSISLNIGTLIFSIIGGVAGYFVAINTSRPDDFNQITYVTLAVCIACAVFGTILWDRLRNDGDNS